MKDVETKVSEAIAIGVRSSGKGETRRYRVEFYLGQLTKAKLEVRYYEEMVRLEEQKAGMPGLYDDECEQLEGYARVLTLRERVEGLRDAATGAGKEKVKAKVTDKGGAEEDEASTAWTEESGSDQETSVKDEQEDGVKSREPGGVRR